jgi:hydrogenase expression/formation protein HypD
MMRVPGSDGDLISARARGGDVRIVYSPQDAVEIARKHHDKKTIFLAVGFETTAPLIASIILTAEKLKLNNFYILNGMVRIPPAIESLLENPDSKIDALLAPGHVCTVSGYMEYEKITEKYDIPVVVTGFEPFDLARGIYLAVDQLENKESQVTNQYSRAVDRNGNKHARAVIDTVFTTASRQWRGLGVIDNSGYVIRERFLKFDAERIFDLEAGRSREEDRCIAADILQGFAAPDQCPEFAKGCSPEHPIGPMMVSSEGVCSAYFKYRRDDAER